MKRNADEIRKAIHKVEQRCGVLLEELLAMPGPVLTGSIVHTRRRCGKKNCHCARGLGHPGQWLSVKVKGKTKTTFIPKDKLESVKSATRRNKVFRQGRAMFVKQTQEILKLLNEHRKSKETKIL